MLHLSVIRIMQDVIEGLWLHVTEDRLQADHSKKNHFQKTLHGKPRGQFFKCMKMTQFSDFSLMLFLEMSTKFEGFI